MVSLFTQKKLKKDLAIWKNVLIFVKEIKKIGWQHSSVCSSSGCYLRVAGHLPFGVENMGSNPIQTTDALFYKVTHKVLRCGSSKTNAPVCSSRGSHFLVTGHLLFGVGNMGSNPLSTTYRGIEQQAVLAGLITQRSEVRILLWHKIVKNNFGRLNNFYYLCTINKATEKMSKKT